MADEYIAELEQIKSQVEAYDKFLSSGDVQGIEAETVQRDRDSLYNRGVEMAQAGFKASGGDKLRALAQGATFGMGEEIEAGIRAPFSDQTYPEIRDELRTGMETYQKGYPSDSMALEAVGGFAVPGMGAAKVVGQAPSLIGQIGRTVSTGAGMGALSGYGYSDAETLGGQGLDTAKGAAFGGVLGGVLTTLPIAGKYASKAYNKLKQEAPDRASEIVGELMRETGWTQSKIQKALDDLGPEGTLADLDQNLLGRLIAARQKSPEAIGMIDDAYAARQAGAKGRVIGALEDTSGFDVGDYKKIARPSGIDDLGGKVAKKQSEVASKMYGEISARQVPNEGAVAGVLSHERVKPIVRDVLQDMNIPANQIDDVLASEVLPLSLIDKVKKGIDDKSEIARRAGEKNAARTWGDRAKDLREASDVHVPEYAAARKDYAAKSGMLDSAQMGRSITKIKDEALELMPGKLAGMTGNEQQMFKMGALADIAEDVNKSGGAKGTGFAGTKIYGQNDPQKEARLGLLAGDKRDELSSALDRESTFHTTFSLTDPTTGSRTAIYDAASSQADEAANAAGMIMDAASMDFPALARAIKSSGGMSREVATEVARKLTNKSLTGAELNRMFNAGELDKTTLEMLQGLMKGQMRAQGALNPAAGALGG